MILIHICHNINDVAQLFTYHLQMRWLMKKKKEKPIFGPPRVTGIPNGFEIWGWETGQYFTEEDYMDPKKPHHLRLKEVRKLIGLNQTEAGQIMFTSQTQYSRWETGKYDIPLFELTVFAIWTNVSLDYLLGLSDNNAPIFTEEERLKRIENMKISSLFNRYHWYDWWGNPESKIHNNKRKK